MVLAEITWTQLGQLIIYLVSAFIVLALGVFFINDKGGYR